MASKETRDLLRKNKQGPVLQLWLNKESQNGATAMALTENTTVNTVSVFIEDDFMQADHDLLKALFEEIGCLPLKNFYVYSFGNNYDVFPVKLLTHVFMYASKLRNLTLYFVELGGPDKYFVEFEKIVSKHEHLREFRMENCRLCDEQLNSTSFGKFVTTVSALPKMETVDLFATEVGYLGVMTAESLKEIASGKHIKSLSLINFALGNDHISALNEAMISNQSLEELSISCDSRYCTNLAPMLATSKSLTAFKLRLRSLKDDVFLQNLAYGLKENRSITRFELEGEKHNRMSKESQKFFIGVLEKNPTIEQLDVVFSDDDMKKKAKYYLKLNQTGKHTSSVKQDDLINALASAENALNFVQQSLAT